MLRRQKIDVAVYDENFHPHVVKDVMISNKEALTDIVVPFNGKVTAINVNENDHAYAKTRFNQRTLDNFVSSLYKIQDPVTRGSVWRNLWLLVMDTKVSSLLYFDFVVKQISHETVDQII